jgi:hypothetical protein
MMKFGTLDWNWRGKIRYNFIIQILEKGIGMAATMPEATKWLFQLIAVAIIQQKKED